LPATQASQTALLVEVEAAVWTVPAAQSVAARQDDWLTPVVYVPSAQPWQTRLVVSDEILVR
jgi:hypothetical protein